MIKTRPTDVFLIGAAALLACVAFLAFSATFTGWGFPLDDAWIHHTFARNLASSGRWSYQGDLLSGGSTGPAWGFLLSLLYLLGLPPVLGTYLLGFLVLWGTAVLGSEIVLKILPEKRWYGLAAGMLVALEWHLVWSAMSGMETAAFILVNLLFFNWLFSGKENWWAPGLLVGLSVWLRPDGLSLIGPAGLVLMLRGLSRPAFFKQSGQFLLGLTAAGAPYFLFNLAVAGDPWPNTFYAKQAEYAVLQQVAYFRRYFQLSKQFLTGVGILLLPGLILQLARSLQAKRWEAISALAWSAGYIGLYAWRLPVVYQHGRYIMPALAIGYLVGLSGMVDFFERARDQLWQRVTARAWLGAAALVLGIFLFLGARAYGLDVAVINTEMVRTSRWIDGSLEDEALIAAHDIGALGYFTDHEILDLAGLVSPDVIGFIRDEARLKVYLDQQQADYLVAFPSWYPSLTADLEVVYSSQGGFAPQLGNDNLTVYRWR